MLKEPCRNKRVQTYFDEYDFEVFVEEMRKIGVSNQSRFVRFLFRRFLEKKSIQDAILLASEVHQLRVELSKIGGNLNQLARSFNQVHYVNQEQLEKVHSGIRFKHKEITLLCKRMEDEIREEFTPW